MSETATKTAEKTAWTPGPWKAMEHPGSSRHSSRTFCIHNEGNGTGETVIATASANDCWGVPLEANARLIAAAPAMAELLNAADRLLTQCYTILCDDAIANRMPGGLKESVHDFVVGNKAGTLLAEIGGAQ